MEIVLIFCLFGFLGSVYMLAENAVCSVMLLDQIKTRKTPKIKRKTRKVK